MTVVSGSWGFLFGLETFSGSCNSILAGLLDLRRAGSSSTRPFGPSEPALVVSLTLTVFAAFAAFGFPRGFLAGGCWGEGSSDSCDKRGFFEREARENWKPSISSS